jgi:hypothetical protein
VGRTLTAVPGTWVPEGAAVTYQWQAGSKDIAGATGKTYDVTADMIGRSIRVRVTATSGAGAVTKTSDGTTEVLRATFTTAPTPKITGTAATDQTVSVDAGSWSATPDSLTITWKRNGKSIPGASGVGLTSYTLTPSDTGEKLTVKVTARRAGFTTASRTSAAVKVAKATFTTTPAPTISGDAVAGATLTADPGTWAPVPSKYGYQWYADGRKISKATKATYTPAASRVGQALQVWVTATRPGYASVTLKSAPVTIAAAP